VPPVEDLEVIRIEAGMPITRFCALIGMPRRTYTRHRCRLLAGESAKGPWPAPVVEAIEPAVAKLAEEFPAWGHRKIWALHTLDHPEEAASQSSVRRAMARRGLLQPVGYQRERRELAKARRAAFVEPPTHRNQVWQLDFSEFETTRDGKWQIAGCTDYVAKFEFARWLAPTQMRHDAIEAVRAAIASAEEILGHPLLEDVTDPATGEIHPVVVVTDNGPAFRSGAFARFIASRPELTHVRTRHRSPGSNGVRERGFGTLKYEQLYRYDIPDGLELARHVEHQRQIFNTRRPHEALDWRFPQDVYLAAVPNFEDPETEPDS
jgi:transposase InsO family protein